jgi:hypothetical protein
MVKIVDKVRAARMKQSGKQVLGVVLAQASGIETRAQSAYLACTGSSSRRWTEAWPQVRGQSRSGRSTQLLGAETRLGSWHSPKTKATKT